VSPRTIRRLVAVVWVAGIAGMIIGSIADNNGAAVTCGLITAAATLGLILVTAAAGPGAFDRGAERRRPATPTSRSSPDLEAAGAAVEEQVGRLLAKGADESEVRELVRRSVALGRGVSESSDR
jgi:hypothetical protein